MPPGPHSCCSDVRDYEECHGCPLTLSLHQLNKRREGKGSKTLLRAPAVLGRTEVFLRGVGVQTVIRASGRGVCVRDGKVGSKEKSVRVTVPLGGLSL